MNSSHSSILDIVQKENTTLVLKIFLVIITLSLSVATVFSSVVLWTIFKVRILREETRYLLLSNLLINDLMYIVLVLVQALVLVTDMPVSYFWCGCNITLELVTFSCGILSLSAMTVDKYMGICWPLHYNSLCLRKRAVVVCGILWAFALLDPVVSFGILTASNTQILFDIIPWCCAGTLFTEQLISRSFLFVQEVVLGVLLLMCCILTVFCYVGIYKEVKVTWERRFVKTNAHKMFCLYVFCLILYLLPAVLLFISANGYLLPHFFTEQKAFILELVTVMVIAVLPRCFCPLVYGLMMKEIQQYLPDLKPRCRANRVNPEVNDEHSAFWNL
ncbi:olfactory receptor 14A16-like [Callorhinchus milii]|uniref:olfactory receptor 14A16-like n=1 Tax=Callorhinchus milii TaxID=7868 RepID=UPI0004571472|nr:olfactory receptor 14A16-like [Callorhinchus milii]|eukprot:gi/632936163/ref/XP_007892691.1/ PREDICTED: olfactory receptor 2V1-like [Callorhinchus milii]